MPKNYRFKRKFLKPHFSQDSVTRSFRFPINGTLYRGKNAVLAYHLPRAACTSSSTVFLRKHFLVSIDSLEAFLFGLSGSPILYGSQFDGPPPSLIGQFRLIESNSVLNEALASFRGLKSCYSFVHGRWYLT